MRKWKKYLLFFCIALLPVFVHPNEMVKSYGIVVSKSISNNDILRFDKSLGLYRSSYIKNKQGFSTGFTYGIKFVYIKFLFPFPYLEFRPGYTFGAFSFIPKLGFQTMMGTAGPAPPGFGFIPYLSLDVEVSFKLIKLLYIDLVMSQYNDIIEYREPDRRLQLRLSYQRNSN